MEFRKTLRVLIYKLLPSRRTAKAALRATVSAAASVGASRLWREVSAGDPHPSKREAVQFHSSCVLRKLMSEKVTLKSHKAPSPRELAAKPTEGVSTKLTIKTFR